RIAGGPKSHEIERVANGGQWISQLVTQHREKLVHSAFAAFEHLNTSYFLLQRPIGSLELLRARRHACLKLVTAALKRFQRAAPLADNCADHEPGHRHRAD